MQVEMEKASFTCNVDKNEKLLLSMSSVTEVVSNKEYSKVGSV
jgi:hypothetical protein